MSLLEGDCGVVIALALDDNYDNDNSGGSDDNNNVHLATIMAVSQTTAAMRVLMSHVCRRTVSFREFESISADVMESVFNQRRNTLINGGAGVGKTVLTNRIYEYASVARSMCVYMLAPTQAAAELLHGGQTIHSFLHIRQTESLDELAGKYARYSQLVRMSRGRSIFFPKEDFPDLVIIDEISMVGDSLLDAIDFILSHRRDAKQPNALFGGAQVVSVGDFCQLPPVGAKHAFTWSKWRDCQFRRFLLERPMRQCDDLAWFNYLQRVRCGVVRYYSMEDGGPRTIDDAEYERLMTLPNVVDRPVILCAENRVVEDMNKRELDRVAGPVVEAWARDDLVTRETRIGASGRPYTRWIAIEGGEQPTEGDREKVNKCWRLQTKLELKVGAKYVVTQNVSKLNGLYNGQTCVYVGNQRFEYRYKGDLRIANATQLIAEHIVPTGRANISIRRLQLALRLGYAQTVHKSQGMTLPRVVFDMRNIRCPGQYYVACSRVRSRQDMVVRNPSRSTLRISGVVLAYVFGQLEAEAATTATTTQVGV